VANVSHELKTPITTIKSYVETIMENELDRETELNFLDVVNKESDRMTRLIQDLLTLSRLDGRLLLKSKEPLVLSDLISEVVKKQSFEAKKHGHKLSFHQLGDIPPVFIARDRLEQILTNVLSNAIKYTPDGGKIEIFAKKLYNNAYIKVKDNGIGIPAKDLDRIFERFYRVDKARSRDLGGTGLGLAIAKEIIQAYGGDISIESVQNEGTEVSITLPIGNTVASEAAEKIEKTADSC
jgi:multi-sensor signal transduction histidine kinase